MQPDMKTLLAGARSFVKKAAQSTVKTAADNGMLQQLLDGGRSLVSKVDLKNPMHTGAIGAGVGALGGLASGVMSDEESPGYMQRALMGGLAGGGLGAGAGALNAKYNPAAPPGPPKTPKLVPPAIGSPDRTQPRLPLESPLNIPRAAIAPVSPATTATAEAASAASPPSVMDAIRKKQQELRDSLNRSFEYSRQPAPVLATPN